MQEFHVQGNDPLSFGGVDPGLGTEHFEGDGSGLVIWGHGDYLVPGWGPAGLIISSSLGDEVYVKDLTILGSEFGAFIGFDRFGSTEMGHQTVHFQNCRFIADGSRLQKWGVFGYGTNATFSDCKWEWGGGVEHSIYLHGFAESRGGNGVIFSGLTMRGCHIESTAAEGVKVVNRPGFQAYPADTAPEHFAKPFGKWQHAPEGGQCYSEWSTVTILDTAIERWAHPHSWRGGAGIVLQGACSNVLVERCRLSGGMDPMKPAFAMDASGEYFDVDGRSHGDDRRPQGNRNVVLKQCLFEGGEGMHPVVRANNAESLTIVQCGIYGDGYVSFDDTPKLVLEGCNTPEINELCSRWVDDVHLNPFVVSKGTGIVGTVKDAIHV